MKYCMYCGTQLRDEDRFCYRCGKPCEVKTPQPYQQQPQYQPQTQYNFSEDWNHFFDGMITRITNWQTIEKEYNTILQKARSVEYNNPTDAACYYYMAALLCYLFYDHLDNPEDERNWAVDLGKSAIKNALRLLQNDEEFKTMSLVFELLGLLKKIDESLIPPKSLLQKLQSTNQHCPHIESIENALVKNEKLRDFYNDTYFFIPYYMLIGGKVEDDIELKIEFALELKNSPIPFNKIIAYTSLADAYFDKGNYSEAQRYAILGKDILGSLTEYDHNDNMNRYWGFCWYLYAKCQEEAGDADFAFTLLQKGATLGIPLCEKELQRLKNEGFCENREEEQFAENANENCELNREKKPKNNAYSLLTPNEQEYLDALKESFDDGVITPRERKIIDRLRVSLGINVERAKELESLLQP